LPYLPMVERFFGHSLHQSGLIGGLYLTIVMYKGT